MTLFLAGKKLKAATLESIIAGPTSFTPTWTGGGAFAQGNGTIEGAHWTSGPMRRVLIKAQYGSTTNQGTGAWSFGNFGTAQSPGFTASDSRNVGWYWIVDASSTSRASGPVILVATGLTVQCQVGGGSPTAAAYTGAGATNVPITWADGDQVHMDFEIPVALS